MPSRDEALAVTLAILVALVVSAAAALSTAGIFGDRRAAQGAAPGPTCAEWTDGCVVCSRTSQGLACSTPGIACTRGPARCLKP